MMQTSVDDIWHRLKELEGSAFETKTGKPFTFEIDGDVFRPSRTDYQVSKNDFRKVLALVPVDGPGAINRMVRGPAYVWAVLHDQRVRGQNW